MARKFSGSSQDFVLGTAAQLQITGDITAAAWLRTTTTTLSLNLVGAYNSASPFTGWGFAFAQGTAGKLGYWSNGNGAWRQSTSAAYNSGLWVHGAVRIKGTGAGAGTFLKNGAADGTFTQTAPGAFTGTKRLAARTDGAGPYIGQLSDITVWAVALTDAEILALARRQKTPLQIRPEMLRGYWPLLGRAALEPDVTRYKAHGKMTGYPVPTTGLFAPLVRRRWFVPAAAPEVVVVSGRRRRTLLGVGR